HIHRKITQFDLFACGAQSPLVGEQNRTVGPLAGLARSRHAERGIRKADRLLRMAGVRPAYTRTHHRQNSYRDQKTQNSHTKSEGFASLSADGKDGIADLGSLEHRLCEGSPTRIWELRLLNVDVLWVR